MKKMMFIFATLLIAGCTDQQLQNDKIDHAAAVAPISEFAALIEKARWGDGKAYLKLAECYSNGVGVKKNLINMLSMALMAEKFGEIESLHDYLDSLAASTEFQLLDNALKNLRNGEDEEAESQLRQLREMGFPEVNTVRGMDALERKDTVRTKHFLELAIEEGSDMAELLMLSTFYLEKSDKLEMDKLIEISDRIPLANVLLSEIFAGVKSEYSHMRNEALAAKYCLKADKYALLGRDAAKWLLDYYRKGGDVELSETDLQRLQILAKDEFSE